MMQSLTFLSILLLVASVWAKPSQPEAPVVSGVQAGAPVVGNPVPSSPVDAVQPAPVVVEHQPAYYSTVGAVGPVESVSSSLKPGPVVSGPVRSSEQYGQPESAALPPNYKPFGSWGLYIGGNPPDGYYTNYYKSLSNPIEKQQVSSEPLVKPAQVSGQSAGNVLRQALAPVVSSSPYGAGGDFYSFAYSQSDLNSGVPVPHSQVGQQVPLAGHYYGAPAVGGAPAAPVESLVSHYGSVSPYSDFYATKKLGLAAPKEVAGQKVGSYQQRSYYYQYPQQAASSAVVGQKPQQVVGYPVPVGSQIVGSQPGVEGSFDPHGVYAFTRYAVKPTVLSQTDSSAYYSYPAAQQQKPQQAVPAQLPVQAGSPTGVSYSPVYGFYGYPMNQLHYSQGMILAVPAEQQADNHHHQHPQAHHHAAPLPVQPGALVESSSDKAALVESGEQVKPQK